VGHLGAARRFTWLQYIHQRWSRSRAINSGGGTTNRFYTKATQRIGQAQGLCVGIDAYASPNRLTGCVHDANTWAALLASNRFDTQLLLDQQAGYDAITAALRTLVQSSVADDVLVFSYSGHGTTVPDMTGRTVDGIEEAMVPADFSADNPKLLMDF